MRAIASSHDGHVKLRADVKGEIRLPMQSEDRRKAVGGRNWRRLSEIQGTGEFPSQQTLSQLSSFPVRNEETRSIWTRGRIGREKIVSKSVWDSEETSQRVRNAG